MKNSEMTYEEFKIWSERNADTHVDNMDESHFSVICQKCGSDNTGLAHKEAVWGMGSAYTGQYRSSDGKLFIKCLDCGAASKIQFREYSSARISNEE